MATSQKTFDQVKSILGKLDRNIDEMRQRRLGDPPPRLPVPTPHNISPVIGPSLNTTIGAGSTLPAINGNGLNGAHVPAPSKSQYGRAQPLRPEARSA
jgi:hypothetical protein